MKVTRTRALRGPNLWSRHPAIEAVVACEGDENAISRLPGFEARLRARFPTIGELHPMSGSGWRGASQAITPPSFISALAARRPACRFS